MKTVLVRASRQYEIRIERGLLRQAGSHLQAVARGRRVLLVSDDTVWPLYGEQVRRSLEAAGFTVFPFVFSHGEASKCARTYLSLLDALCEARLTRQDTVAALGGGVVGDLAGFAASTYLRGIGFVQLPTTLLAMVDSSVGGKTAIDLPAGKNLAGTFYQPQLVLCDPDCLSTLPEDIFRDGCAEVIKYALLSDAVFFDELRQTPARQQLEHVIAVCVRMKRDIVAQDEFDRGTRQLLNFGHTFGHAIEACSDYTISHGRAVGIGMAMMLRAAARRGLCEEADCQRALELLSQYGLPLSCPYPAQAMLEAVLHDKKAGEGQINLIVPVRLGQCEIRTVSTDSLTDWLHAGGAL